MMYVGSVTTVLMICSLFKICRREIGVGGEKLGSKLPMQAI